MSNQQWLSISAAAALIGADPLELARMVRQPGSPFIQIGGELRAQPHAVELWQQQLARAKQ